MKTLGLVVLLLALDAQAQMYKCVDARGVTQYTDKPQPGCKPAAIKASPPISGQVRQRNEDFAAQDAALKGRQLKRDASAAQERAERQALEQRCARLREEYSFLSSGARVARRNAQGEREFMDDATREQRIARLQQDLRGCP